MPKFLTFLKFLCMIQTADLRMRKKPGKNLC